MALNTLDRRAPPLFQQGPTLLSRMVFFSVLSICLMVADVRFAITQPLRTALSAALAPVVAVGYSPADWYKKARNYFISIGAAQEKIQTAQQQVAKLALQNARLQQLEQENAALRQIVHLRTTGFPTAAAVQVLYDAADPYSRKVIIDRGRMDDIQLGSPVMDAKGLIGQVTRVYLRSAEVSLLISQDYTIPLRNRRTGTPAVAYGAPTIADGRLELKHLSSNSDIQVGDELVTSGVDGVYPANLLVAVVEKLERRTDSAFARVYCKPAGDMNSVHMVVIRPLGLMLEAEAIADLQTKSKIPIPAPKQPASTQVMRNPPQELAP